MKKSVDWLDALTLLFVLAIDSQLAKRQAEPITTRWLRAKRSRRRMSNLKSGIGAALDMIRPRR